MIAINNGIIGIVGGMGPLAGIDLSWKIINQTIADNDQDHLPQILYSIPEIIGDRTKYIIGNNEENPAFNIAKILLRLESMNCSVAGLSCNTAYAPQIFNVIQNILVENNSSIKLLHIIKEVGTFIKKYYPGITNVGILGTSGTYTSKLYNQLSKLGLNTINVSPQEQKKVHASIYYPEYGIKSTTRQINKKAKDILENSAFSLIKMNTELIVLGCTELPLVFTESQFNGIPVIDATLVLARALIHAHSPRKLKPWNK